MLQQLLLCMSLTVGQPNSASLGAPVAPDSSPTSSSGSFCPIQWLRPWKAEDLQMKPFEPAPTYGGCKGLWWCPKEEKKDNGNGEKKIGNNDKEGPLAKNEGDKKNGTEEKTDEAPKTLTPLMQMFQCYCPSGYERMNKRGDNIYG